MNIRKVLKIGTESLKEKEIDTAILDAEVIFSYVIGKPKEYLHTYPKEKIGQAEVKKFNKLIKKRARGCPLAYILGKKEFYGLNFLVEKGVLTPRPETELIIDEVKALVEKNNLQNINIIDVGTGSGCIIITLAKLLKSNYHYYAIDKYSKPLKVARKNAQKHNLSNINFQKSNLLNFFIKNPDKLSGINIITANLPYLTKNQFKDSQTIKKEPKKALISENSGLRHYEKLFKQIRELKSINSGKKFYIFCEIDPKQERKISELIKKFFSNAEIDFKKDLAGLSRLTKIVI